MFTFSGNMTFSDKTQLLISVVQVDEIMNRPLNLILPLFELTVVLDGAIQCTMSYINPNFCVCRVMMKLNFVTTPNAKVDQKFVLPLHVKLDGILPV